ncbi:MAG: HAD hydrolase-like protein [Lactobacillus sp.]|jgi:pyrimidine 5'-nucleotidase|nr:HAD hydrolase-like protein [Lactobacillus sp.]
MDFCKKAIIFDLDNTLYSWTPEFSDLLDRTMAQVVIDLGADVDFDTAVSLVKQSYAEFRDGGEIFHREYGIDKREFYDLYHKVKPVEKIIPYEWLPERLEKMDIDLYVLSYSSIEAMKKILKQLGLYEVFRDRFFSVEDFDILTKNESPEVYYMLCDKIGYKPEDCIFVDDSWSNLEIPKQIGMTTVRLYYKNNSARDKTYIDAAYKGLESFLDAFDEEYAKCPHKAGGGK